MLKLKLWYFGHLMERTDSLERTLILGKIEGRRRRWWQRMWWLDGIIDLIDMSLSFRSWWWTGKPGMLQSRGHKESDTTELDTTELLNWTVVIFTKMMPQLVKNLHAVWETWVQSLGWEDPLEKGMPTHSSFLAWRIPWTWGHKESDTTEQLSLLPNLCQSNETSFWFQKTYQDLYIQMNVARAKSQFKFFFFPMMLPLICSGTYTSWNITQPLKRIHLNQF